MIRCQTGTISVGELAAAFERLAETDDPFAGYPIAYLE
jgi:hypothetical protein